MINYYKTIAIQVFLNVYQKLIAEGTQKNVVDTMQSRVELYDYLDYYSYEQKLDALFSEDK